MRSVYRQMRLAGLHLPRKAPVGRVEAGEIGDALEVRRFVDRHHRKRREQFGLVKGAQKAPADAAIAVDCEAEGLFRCV